MNKRFSLGLLGLVLAGCSIGSAYEPVNPSTGSESAGHRDAPTAPVTLLSEQVGGVESSSGRQTATLTVTNSDFTVALQSGQKITLIHGLGDQVKARLTVLNTFAPPPFRDHLLVSLTDNQSFHSWVLVPESTSIVVALDAETDQAVAVEGYLLAMPNLYMYNTATGRYEPTGPLPAELSAQDYTARAYVRLPVQGVPEAAFWTVRKRSDGWSNGPDGVLVALGEKAVLMRPADFDQPGPIGPMPAVALTAQDLDMDGTVEYMLYGLAGAHTWGVWVYQFDPTRSEFLYRDTVIGDISVTWATDQQGHVRFRTDTRDYSGSEGRLINTRYYVWQGERFKAVP